MSEAENMLTPKAIRDSMREFDLSAPLSESESLLVNGVLNSLQRGMEEESRPPRERSGYELVDLEEDQRVPKDDTGVPLPLDDYNRAYAHWTKCQAISRLKELDEWQALEELVLRPYVASKRRENLDYRGDDRDKAFALRMRQQCAEEFYKFVLDQIAEAASAPRPAKMDPKG